MSFDGACASGLRCASRSVRQAVSLELLVAGRLDGVAAPAFAGQQADMHARRVYMQVSIIKTSPTQIRASYGRNVAAMLSDVRNLRQSGSLRPAALDPAATGGGARAGGQVLAPHFTYPL